MSRQETYPDEGASPSSYWTQGTSAHRYARGASSLRGRPPLRRGGKGQSDSRVNYQKKRVEKMRVEKGSILVDHLSKELREKLMPGLKNEEEALRSNLNAPVEKAIPVSVTTRQAGLSHSTFMRALARDQKSDQLFNIDPEIGRKLYRVTLACIETKLLLTRRKIGMCVKNERKWAQLNEDSERINLCTGVTILPVPLANMVNEIGIMKTQSTTYYHAIEPNARRGAAVIPTPENLILSNLRDTVVQLANDQTDEQIRREFRDRNPIPGAIWSDDHLLENAVDIIPANYGNAHLRNDIRDVKELVDLLGRRLPKFINSGKIDWQRFECDRAFSVCTSVANLKISDKANQLEPMRAYYQQVEVTGETETFNFGEKISDAEQLKGIINLLGECPNAYSRLKCYLYRHPDGNPFETCLGYSEAVNMMFS